MFRSFFAIPLWQRTAAGFALGIIAGLILREQATVWLKPIGDVYLNLIRMVVAPLVLFTIASWYLLNGIGIAYAGVSFVMVLVMTAFELFIQALQAYVFVLLAVTYIQGALAEHH